ncbi:MAG TPA: TonB-dependent receptor, partial [Arenibacter sp.]|nr:TonB-dependent receptor [Arenibacter sp.]
GYIDRASSELDSYFLQGAYMSDRTLIKALMFGGHQTTYQAWNGIDRARLESDRTFNTAGIYTDENGETQFYDNEVDDYKQNHFQLHWNQKFSDNWNTNLAFHYTKGEGYFEQYRQDDDFVTYGITPFVKDGDTINTTDLIRRRWLDNDFYGTTFSANYQNKKLNLILGGGWNRYGGDHFGEILWARFSNNRDYLDRYYDDTSTKNDLNVFAKANFQLNSHWSVYGDLQYRTVNYTANGRESGLVDDTFNFFNPKGGVIYDLNANTNFYLSYARANREPNRNDYKGGSPKPEKLDDIELGWRFTASGVRLNTNIYYMKYKDQLVLTGELNDVGGPLRANVGDSYRLGLEVDATVALGDKFMLRPNVALSDNRNRDFVFERDGSLVNLGDTHISFSPSVIAGNIFTYLPNDNLQMSLLTKFVGKQYMGNIDAKSSVLDAYSQTDVNVQYVIDTNGFIKNIVLSGLVNNIFDSLYESNGFFFTYDDDYSVPGTITTIEGAGYYPQAGINFLLGASFNF